MTIMTKNLKKMLCVALAIVALVLLVTLTCIGCSSGEAEETTAPSETSAPVETTEATEAATETTEAVTEATTAPTEAPEETTAPATEPAETEAPKKTGGSQSGNKGNQSSGGNSNQNNSGTGNQEDSSNQGMGSTGMIPVIQETVPAETTPPATEVPKPVETTPPATEAPKPVETTPPATEVPTEPAPTEHQHNWEMKWYPEEGHYGETYIICACGHASGSVDGWYVHVKSITDAEEVLAKHPSYTSTKEWIIDAPERTEWVCSGCGTVSNTHP